MAHDHYYPHIVTANRLTIVKLSKLELTHTQVLKKISSFLIIIAHKVKTTTACLEKVFCARPKQKP